MKSLSEQIAEKLQARGYRQTRPVDIRSGLPAIEVEKKELIDILDEELKDPKQD